MITRQEKNMVTFKILPRPSKVNDINVLFGLVQISQDGVEVAGIVLGIDDRGPAAVREDPVLGRVQLRPGRSRRCRLTEKPMEKILR